MNGATPTVVQLFDETALRKPDAPALGFIRSAVVHWHSWRDLQQNIERRRDELAGQGIQHGDLVATRGVNSVEWVVTDLAILALGAVHVALGEHGHAPPGLAISPEQARLLDQGQAVRIGGGDDLPPDLAAIVATSGTSLQARGVMLSHENLASNAMAVSQAVGGSGNELRLSFLPFTHLYARVCDLYAWIYRGSRLVLAESRQTLFRDLYLVQPTSLNGVPYFYQKVFDRKLGLCESGESATLTSVLGGKVKQCFCGGAALSPDLQQAFAEEGVPLMNGYGLTEASPVVTASRKEENRIGTVGKPVPGVEVRIAEDGEVHVRGPNVMVGYWNDPPATANAIQDGWLRTGDLGRLDEAGHLVLTGRSRETVVLSTGKNVAPSGVEARLGASPWIEQVCVVGEGRKALAALIVPNPERVRAMVRCRRLWVWSKRGALRHPAVRAIFEQEIAACLAGCPPEEQVRAFTLLPRGFSIERGEMTAKLSLRRGVIEVNLAKEIQWMNKSVSSANPLSASESSPHR